MNDKLESEKRNRADVDKERRKLESDLKICQENVEELDRIKHDLEESLKRSVWGQAFITFETVVIVEVDVHVHSDIAVDHARMLLN